MIELEHAEKALTAERANRPPVPSPCRCLKRGAMYTINLDGQLICLRCGRRW
jgi:hypothetical protein